MNNKPKAFIREANVLREITLASAGKPSIDKEFLERWQRVLNLIAKVIHMPAAIIMQITQDTANVLLRSEGTENSFQYSDSIPLQRGFYCESELGRNGLLIENAGGAADDGDTLQTGPNTTAHFGLPVLWPDGELFGTICVLDGNAKTFKKEYQSMLSELKLALERELAFLCYQQRLIYSAETDALTSIYNRRKMEDVLTHEFDRAKRYAGTFSLTILDINGFKQINDTYGHNVGDKILTGFAQGINAKIRETDFFGRWGGDEFILVCPHADYHETNQMINRIRRAMMQELRQAIAFTDFCFGIAQFEPDDQSYLAVVKKADQNLYLSKEQLKAEADNYA